VVNPDGQFDGSGSGTTHGIQFPWLSTVPNEDEHWPFGEAGIGTGVGATVEMYGDGVHSSPQSTFAYIPINFLLFNFDSTFAFYKFFYLFISFPLVCIIAF